MSPLTSVENMGGVAVSMKRRARPRGAQAPAYGSIRVPLDGLYEIEATALRPIPQPLLASARLRLAALAPTAQH